MGLDKKYHNFVPLNADFDVSDFKREIKLIKDAGFNLVGISHYYIEDTFIFKTQEEANKAYEIFEKPKNPKIVGWWYGKKDFLKEIKTAKIKPDKIIWL